MILSTLLLSAAQSPAPTVDDWSFTVTPYLWAIGLEGDVRIANTSAEFEADFSDLLEQLNFALMVRTEAWKGSVGFYLDPVYAEVEAESAGGVSADLTTELLIADFGMLYRALDSRSDEGRARILDLSFGGRYYHLSNDVDFAVLADREASTDLLDVTLGARYAMELNDRLGFMVDADIGGFDLGGSATDLAWSAEALGSFRCGASGRLWAGYRTLDIDDDKGGARGNELELSGPILGYQFRF